MIFFLIKLVFTVPETSLAAIVALYQTQVRQRNGRQSSTLHENLFGILVGEFYDYSFYCVYLTACIFAINFYFCLIL